MPYDRRYERERPRGRERRPPPEPPDRMAGRAPRRMPDRRPDRMPGGMPGGTPDRGEYGPAYEQPRVAYGPEYRARFHGYGLGYGGGALRSRGSYEAGQLRSGRNPRDEFEFRWGEGYVGGRGYGGTNYDLTHGYRTAGPRRRRPEEAASAGVGGMPAQQAEPPRRPEPHQPPEPRPASRPRQRTRPPAHEAEAPARAAGLQGPARYGYGPYHERLKRRRRSDDEIRDDVDEAIFYDTWVDADRIDVEVDDGIVTLRGTLPNFDEVRYATDDAWDVDGVRGVRTELEVAQESTTETLGHRREYSPGDVAQANEASQGRDRPQAESERQEPTSNREPDPRGGDDDGAIRG